MTDIGFTVALLQSTFRLGTPLLLAALGETVSERSGVINIGIEGIMLTGAFVGFSVTYAFGSPAYGAIAATVAGAILGLVFALACVTMRADQVVVGTALNMFAMGVTGFLYRRIFGLSGSARLVQTFPVVRIPILSDIPVLGPVLFSHNIIVYLALILVPIIWVLFYKTSAGLAIISAGQHPRAADTAGIDIFRLRYLSLIFAGMVGGLGGSFLSIAHTNTFFEMMTAGRGFIALAVVIFGKWDPWGVLGASLLFGGANALQLRLQAIGQDIPYHIILMLPYILTIIAVVSVSKRKVGAPAALGVPYRKS